MSHISKAHRGWRGVARSQADARRPAESRRSVRASSVIVSRVCRSERLYWRRSQRKDSRLMSMCSAAVAGASLGPGRSRSARPSRRVVRSQRAASECAAPPRTPSKSRRRKRLVTRRRAGRSGCDSGERPPAVLAAITALAPHQMRHAPGDRQVANPHPRAVLDHERRPAAARSAAGPRDQLDLEVEPVALLDHALHLEPLQTDEAAMRWVGIDLHHRRSHVAVIDE
jgi:hypothetical protein